MNDNNILKNLGKIVYAYILHRYGVEKPVYKRQYIDRKEGLYKDWWEDENGNFLGWNNNIKTAAIIWWKQNRKGSEDGSMANERR